MNNRFDGQIVIISGGIGDIGLATVKEFARQGASVAIGDILPREKVINTLKELDNENVKYHYHQVDVANAAAVHQWIQIVESALGIPNIVIANAATATLGTLLEISPKQWKSELNVNLDGAFYLTQAVTKEMKKAALSGAVVFVGSWAAHTVHSHLPAYSVSKAGLRMLCKCLALELAPHGIVVNEIAPGYVDAGLSGRIWADHPKMKAEAVEKVPVRKLISAQEVAEQIVRLCDPENKHCTGSTLLMDGGLSLL